MGLTVHYSFKSMLVDKDDVRGVIETMRQVASGLGFQRVSELFELHGDAADFQSSSVGDPLYRLEVQACELAGMACHCASNSGNCSKNGVVVFTGWVRLWFNPQAVQLAGFFHLPAVAARDGAVADELHWDLGSVMPFHVEALGAFIFPPLWTRRRFLGRLPGEVAFDFTPMPKRSRS